ncbi:MAG: N-acetylglucosamine kinase [Bacteroidetes bacterium QH_2_63_10]|nr:MAG: N-acetylglucosamine kinase [Bacteroidetes bacterium QH_2_63_10]
MSTKRFLVGLDAGGSNTLLRATCEGCSEQMDRRGAAANPQRTGVEQSARTLAGLVRRTMRSHRPIDRLSVCAGVAGAGRPAEQTVLADHLRRALDDEAGAVHVEVVHDAHIALATAFGSGSGLVIIAGTGSVVFARAQDDTTYRAGGWGYLLGDAGSGYAVGRAGLRAVAEAFDGGANTSLRARMDEQYGIDGQEALIHRVYQDELALQDVAPLVMAAAANGDSVASEILTSQAAALMQQVTWLLEREDGIAPRVALLGGMLRNEHYAQVLRRALRTQVPDWSVEVLRHEPVVAALRRARHLDE